MDEARPISTGKEWEGLLEYLTRRGGEGVGEGGTREGGGARPTEAGPSGTSEKRAGPIAFCTASAARRNHRGAGSPGSGPVRLARSYLEVNTCAHQDTGK